MSLRENDKELTIGREVGDLARIVLPRHTAKALARLMGREVATVTFWLRHNFSRYAIRRAAAVLLVELDRQDAERAVARRRLEKIAGDQWIGLSRIVSEVLSGN